MKTRVHLYVAVLAMVAAVTLATSCSKTPTDQQIVSAVQDKFSVDSGLQGKQIAVQASAGAVTLGGTVDNEGQREAAARYAASVAGVKQVINNLSVASAMPMPEEPAPAPAAEQQAPQRSKPTPARRPGGRHVDDTNRNDVASTAFGNDPFRPADTPQQPMAPPPPQKVTVPSGTTLAVRLVDNLDSETATQGQTFRATLDTPIAVDGEVVVPAGHDVEGHVVAVQSAGHFSGRSLLELQLDRISAAGKYYNIQTDQWKREGSSRGKNTAAKVGAGAAIGAVIGGLIGGGKGAAVGAASGGGIGGGVQAATKGQQIKLASETVLNFTLQSAVSVVPTTKGPREGHTRFDQSSNN